MIKCAEELHAAVATLTPPLAVDTETTGLDTFADKITMCVIGDATRAFAFDPALAAEILKFPQPLLLHNQKFDMKMLYRQGVDLRPCKTYDTMLMHHLADENASHALDDIVQYYWGDTYKKDFWAKWGKPEGVPEAEMEAYACKDVAYTRKLYDRLVEQLQADEVPWSLVEHVHMLARSLLDTEIQGVRVDLPYLVELGNTLTPLITNAKASMEKLAEVGIACVRLDQQAKEVLKAWTPKGKKWRSVPVPEFNWNSHKQLASLLYGKLELPVQYNVDKKTRLKKVSTDDKALESIENLHPLPKALREYSTYQKVYTAFIEGTLGRVQDSCVYPSFNVNGTVTGRISSSDPNLQQVPAAGEWAKVRGIYIPDDGHVLISADYEQLEVVIAAHFSQDPNLLRVVIGGESKHDITAAALGVPRSVAKTLNFALQYGCGPKKVAEILNTAVTNVVYRLEGVPSEEMERKRMQDGVKAYNQYWKTYAGERDVIAECAAKVRMGEPIVTPWGRHRRFPTDWAQTWMQRAAERQAYSALIQGTGADCTSWAYYQTHMTLQARGWGRGLFPVHDEIIISVRKDKIVEAGKLMRDCMVAAGELVKLTVPLKAKVNPPTDRWTK